MTNSLLPSPLRVEAPELGAPQLSECASSVELQPNGNVIQLPCGYVDESGSIHDQAVLIPLTGHVEYLLGHRETPSSAATFVTELLAHSVKRIGSLTDIDASLIRELLVDDRDFLTIKLRMLTFGKKINCVLRCPDTDCDRLMDLTLNLDAVFDRKPVSQRYFTMQLSPGSKQGEMVREIEFRLPTGGDQEACAAISRVDGEAAVEALLARCIRRIGDCTAVDSLAIQELGPDARQEIEERMSELGSRADIADIEIEASCPECCRLFNSHFDVVTFLRDELKSGFRSLESEIHFLAWHYHWSEQEILSLTRPRRKRYVALVQSEVDRLNQMW